MSAKIAPRTLVLLKSPRPPGDAKGERLLIEHAKVFTGRTFQDGSILLENGIIRRIGRRIKTEADQRINGSGLLAIPGLIDVHVHLRDMGFAYKEDFMTGTSAAAAGGFTTVLDMPNTRPPTDSPRRLREKMKRAQNRILVNVGFHAAAIEDEPAIAEMASIGAFSLKLYMPKPIPDLAVENDLVLSRLMRTAARYGLPLTVHAEDRDIISAALKTKVRTFENLAKTRPARAETRAVSRILHSNRRAHCAIHFSHITLAHSLSMISKFKMWNVSSEVTPHHLLLSRTSLTRSKWKAWMVPPLRSETARKNLLSATVKGHASVVASDHAPHTIEEKSRSPQQSPPGIPGLETTLALLLTLANRGQIALSAIIHMLSTRPAHLFRLASKGRLEEGYDGDVVLVDLKKRSKIDPGTFLSKAKFTPFEGKETQGSVRTTIVGGTVVYHEGSIVAKPGLGHVVAR